MAHIPLHHKYRPQTFADLVGQEAIATTLTNALRLEKIAPAYLFTGPRGTGKTSSARILAKSLNCMASQVPTAQPCGKCAVCSSISVGAALDIIEIDAASNTGVDNIRELIERAQYAPVQCRYKVYIIDECHMLTTAAFNSLLKTLEEPPAHVVFVLATTDPQRVLPTIISRCQRFDYRRIPVDAMVKHLTYIAGIESIEIAPASVTLIAQIAQGGLRDAESLLDRLSLLDGEITPDRVYDAIGSVPERDLLGILQSIATSDPESLLDRTRTILERGKEPLTVLQNLAGCYRDLTIAKTAPKRPDLVPLTGETWTGLCKIAQSWELNWILAGQKHLKDSEIQLKHTTQPQLWLEIAILGLLNISRQPSPAVTPSATAPAPQPVSPPSSAPPSHPTTPTPPPAATSAPPPAATTAPIAANAIDITTTWEQVLQQLLPASRDLFKPFGKLVSVSAEQAVVAMKSSTMQTIAASKVPELAKVFSQMFGRDLTVKLEVMGKSQPQSIAALPAKPPAVVPPPQPIEASVPAPVPSPPPPIEASVPAPVTTPPVMPVAGEYLTEEEEIEDLNEELPESPPDPISSPAAILPIQQTPVVSEPQILVEIEPPDPIANFAEQPMDFAEPPDSIDLDRAANTLSFDEQEDPEIEPQLQAATDNLVKLFSGEIIDRHHELFDKIVGN
ncbi:DNA polymerase III subunit gamma/tau [Chamaesiphon sp. OTE_8_metabat_110]|uniref:DNA polymerase III subunit gamma/tau n=1 Tax=Chamaesiphon sp. OTE_8_metabat_110 TaxID=2964696 RepID=UPI00286BDE46|nr:DNA polymerase III subunit gamma/tau [Chamaesiphon sp. OTE_8_metabat_110]